MDKKSEKFSLYVPEEKLLDLKNRLTNTILPDEPLDKVWQLGTDLKWFKSLLEYWINKFDWREQESKFNSFEQYVFKYSDTQLHYILKEGKGPRRIPLLLLHGWPGSLFEFMELIPILNDPRKYGIKTNISFDVVAPSLPGFGLSFLKNQRRWGAEEIAGFLLEFMTEILNFKTFGIQGGDWGSIIGSRISALYPDNVIGLHINFLPLSRDIGNSKKFSSVERKYFKELKHWKHEEMGYYYIQGTKPQTLAYGLMDSPSGLAAWISEKFYTWTDCNGLPENSVSFDKILANICLYWFTGSIGSSFWPYYDRYHGNWPISEKELITVPTGYSEFPKEILKPPKIMAEKIYTNIVNWTCMPRGGHFAALEEPLLLAKEIYKLFAKV